MTVGIRVMLSAIIMALGCIRFCISVLLVNSVNKSINFIIWISFLGGFLAFSLQIQLNDSI